MAPRRYHLPQPPIVLVMQLVVLVLVLSVQPSIGSPVTAADIARYYNALNHYEKDHKSKLWDLLDRYDNRYNDNSLDHRSEVDRQSIYDMFESYASYPPYSSPSYSHSGFPYGYSSSYNTYGPPSDYSSWGSSGSLGSPSSWVGSGSWAGSGSSSGSGGGYKSSRHVLRLEPRCDCAPVDLLALLSGGTALCALGLFCILQAANGVSITNNSSVSVSGRQLLSGLPLPGGWRDRMDSWQLPAVSEELPSRLEWLLQQLPSRLQPIPQKLSVQLRQLLKKLPEQQLADRVTDVTCEVASQLETRQLGRSVRHRRDNRDAW